MRKKNPWFYTKNDRFNSLFFRNFVLILTVILVPVLFLCTGMFFYFQNTYFKEINSSGRNALKQVQINVDTMQMNAEMLGRNLASDTGVSSFLTASYENGFTFDEARELKELVAEFNRMCSGYIEDIYAYSLSNHYIINRESVRRVSNFNDMNWLDAAGENTERQSRYIMARVRAEKSQASEGNYPCITTAFRVPLVSGRKPDGFVVINMNNLWIERLTRRTMEEYQDFYILDRAGKVMYNCDYGKIGQDFFGTYGQLQPSEEEQMAVIKGENGRFLANMVYSPSTHWYYVYFTGMEEYQSRVTMLLLIVLGASMLLSAAAVAAAYKVSIKVFLPIRSIVEMIEDPKEFYEMNSAGSSKNGIPNELKHITASFMSYVTEEEKARMELTDYVTRLKQAQVALLQTQINPHFLFNTFQTLNFMAMGFTKSDNEVSRAIEMLSQLFSRMTEVDKNLVTVREEMEYSKAYIGLEQLRFPDEFAVCWDIPEEIKEYLTLKISFQPLLENCIRHGFRTRRGEARITVTGRLEGERIHFAIKDNGEGKEEQWIRKMNEELDDFQTIVGKHIGIRNVNQRIKLLFGREYGLRIGNGSVGFEIHMVIPAVREEA